MPPFATAAGGAYPNTYFALLVSDSEYIGFDVYGTGYWSGQSIELLEWFHVCFSCE